MADTDFSNLPATNTIASTDQLLVVRNGAAYRFAGTLPTVDAAGRFGVGAAAPAALLHVAGSASGAGEIARFERTDAGEADLSIQSIGAQFMLVRTNGTILVLGTGQTLGQSTVGGDVTITAAALAPGADNGRTLGTGAARWSTIYAASGTISTSDERDKHWLGTLSEAHVRAARRIVAEIGLYQWHAAIAEKGADGARIHVGPRAQAVARIMVEEGLEQPFEGAGEPHFRHGFLCYDRWPETPAQPAVAEQRGEGGEVVVEGRGAIPGSPAGDRFGLRVDQLTMFLLAAEAVARDAFEARLTALEAS